VNLQTNQLSAEQVLRLDFQKNLQANMRINLNVHTSSSSRGNFRCRALCVLQTNEELRENSI